MNNTYSHQTVFDHITKSNLSSVAKSNPDLYARYVEMEKELAAELKKLNFSDNVRGNHKSIILPKIGDDFFPIILVGDDEVEDPQEMIKKNEQLTARVIRLDAENKQIGFSLNENSAFVLNDEVEVMAAD